MTSQTSQVPVKCACPMCNCLVFADQGVVRDGKVYCCKTCAYECTRTTCVCVHEQCGVKK